MGQFRKRNYDQLCCHLCEKRAGVPFRYKRIPVEQLLDDDDFAIIAMENVSELRAATQVTAVPRPSAIPATANQPISDVR